MSYELLQQYVERGYSIREIAKLENKGFSTIRYWLSKHRLKTKKRKKIEIPPCKYCGNPIENYRSPKKFCNTECSQEFQRKRHIKRVEEGRASRGAIRTYLLAKSDECSCCGLTEWMGQVIILEVDHIDGNSENNSLENLRLLCPNCHSQTETYKGKNKGKGRHYRRVRYKEGKSF
jgi:transposase-like protein/RNA polymerase subunit RPABC4/transcription elongation factor Spt4